MSDPSDREQIASICVRYGGDRTRMMDVLYDVHHAQGYVSSQAIELPNHHP